MMRQITTRIGAQRWQMVQRYASSTTYMAVSLVAHAAGLVILARALGTEQFGLLTLVTTGSNLGLTWCGLGSGEVLRRMVSRDVATYPKALGHALTLVMSTGLVLSLVCALILARFVTVSPNAWTNTLLIGMIVFSNILLFAWIGLAEQILLAHDRLQAANVVNLSSGAGRVIAVVFACLVFGVSTLEGYAYWHLGFYLILAIGCGVFVAPFGQPRGGVLRDELRRGATISLAGLMIMLRKNVDVLMVNAIATPTVVGIYAVASRVVATASVVTASLDRLVYSNLARAGQAGPAATLAAASRYARYALGLCGLAVAGLWGAAPLIPFVFGEAYRPAIPLVQILAGTLCFTSLHWLAVDALTAAERHNERLVVEVVTGLLGLVGLIVLGRWLGMTGVVWSVYLSGALVVVGLWGVLYWLARRQLAQAPIKPPE